MKRHNQDEAHGETITKYRDFGIAHRRSLPEPGDIQAQLGVERNAVCAKAGREAQSTSQPSADTAVQKVRQARSSPSFDEHTLSSAFLQPNSAAS